MRIFKALLLPLLLIITLIGLDRVHAATPAPAGAVLAG